MAKPPCHCSGSPAGYGIGRHGWISIDVPRDAGEGPWELLREWIRTSYTLVAPKKLAQQVLEQDGLTASD